MPELAKERLLFRADVDRRRAISKRTNAVATPIDQNLGYRFYFLPHQAVNSIHPQRPLQ